MGRGGAVISDHSFVGVQLLYTPVLVSAVHIKESLKCIHIVPLFLSRLPILPSRSHRARAPLEPHSSFSSYLFHTW